jgi:Kef-type K+ transport system membrane component KefB
MEDVGYANFMGVLIIVVIAPIIASIIPKVRVPSIVLEFVIGVIVGPEVLGWIGLDVPLEVLSVLALSFLLFTAGTEVELPSLKGPVLPRSIASYGVGLLLGLLSALVLGALDVVQTPSFIAIILSATGLGAVIPVLRGAGLTATSVGQTILIVGSVAEFSAVMLLSILFAEGDATIIDHLLFFGVFIGVTGAVWYVLRKIEQHDAFSARLEQLDGGTAQIRIRLAVLVLAVFLALSSRFGLETILGAFVAGIILGDLRHHERGRPTGFWPKIDAIGFGFLIPIYFVISGLRFDLSALVDSPSAIARVPLFLALFLLCRGVPALLFRSQLGRRTTVALALLSATSLSFVLTATDVGVRVGKLQEINATAMVGAAVLAMVLFPLGAQALLPRAPAGAVAEKS